MSPKKGPLPKGNFSNRRYPSVSSGMSQVYPSSEGGKTVPRGNENYMMIQSFHLSLLRKYMLVLSNLLLKKTHLKDHFYLSNRKNLLGQRFQEPRLYCSKTLAPNCFLQIKAASTHLAVPISSVST